MNWHRIFHLFKACWHDAGYTEWETGRIVRHGPYIEGVQVDFYQYRYPIRQCCRCPKTWINTDEAATSHRQVTDENQP